VPRPRYEVATHVSRLIGRDWHNPLVTTEREVLTYELFGTAVQDLARQVVDSGYEPDLVLSIARGGLGLGMGLGYALDVKNLSAINVEFYTGVDERLDVPIMLPPTPDAVDLAGLKVLIADDVADTGKTLEIVRDFCADHVAEARMAVIYEKPRTVIRPDYVWRRTESWIDFPWSSTPPLVRRSRPGQ
jgi:hypoxanthine phosphoribosyltransferase